MEDIKNNGTDVTPNWRPLSRNNFVLMIVSGLLIIIGFVLMTGGASGTDEFNPDIFSTRRIVIGPMISFLGFVLMAVSILVKPKERNNVSK